MTARMVRADQLQPGDVVEPAGWTVHTISQRNAPIERLRMVHVEWAEGLDEHWAPSILPPGEEHPIRVDRGRSTRCSAHFGSSDSRCAKKAGHDGAHSIPGGLVWGDALVLRTTSEDRHDRPGAQIVAVDHFAGAGGWSVAAQALGIREYGTEIMREAIRTRSANGFRTIYRDVWSGLFHPHLVPPHDLKISSPPCQTFSLAGNGEGRDALADVLEAIDDRRYTDTDRLFELTKVLDPRTALVLTPLAHVWAHRPRLIALEQVPQVLPVWNAIGAVLRTLGYSVWTGILSSEMYGVPQTRQRAILMARSDGVAEPPKPTHSRYYPLEPHRQDAGVLPWISMAEALGWGMTERPSLTVTSGGAETGGYEPFPTNARAAMEKAQARGAWVIGNQDSQLGRGMKRRQSRHISSPSQTVTGQERNWKCADRPATTVAADPRITAREHHEHGEQSKTSLTLTRAEAATLQSFPEDFAWRGSKTKQFLQVGNAVPPLMAQAILGALTAEARERSPWEEIFAEVAG